MTPQPPEQAGAVQRTAGAVVGPATETAILLNQDGYLPELPKTALVRTTRPLGDSPTFTIKQNGKVVYQGKLSSASRYSPWGRAFYYYQLDFSSFQRSGTFQLSAAGLTAELTISTQTTDRIAQSILQFFQVQRCGTAVPNWHRACHLDDGGGKLTGGWHDAGDYGKYIYTAYYSVFGFLKAYEQTKNHHFLAEADWGLDFLAKMVKPDGNMHSAVFGDWEFAPPEQDTDNIPGTGDDRPGTPEQWGDAKWAIAWCSAVFAYRAYLANQAGDKKTAGKYLALAQKTNEYIKKTFSDQYLTKAENFQILGGVVLSGLYLQKLTGLSQYQSQVERAIEYGLRYQDPSLGFFGRQGNPFIIDYQPYTYLEAFAIFADMYPNSELGIRVKASLNRLVDKHLLPLAQANPYHQLQWLDLQDKLKPDGRLTVDFYPPQEFMQGATRGQNSYYLGAANIAMISYGWEKKPELLRLALNQYNWVLGVNPHGVSMLEGHGQFFTPAYHHRYFDIPGAGRGAVPGALTNGIGCQSVTEDEPWYDFSTAASASSHVAWQTNEPWLPQETDMLLLALRLNHWKVNLPAKLPIPRPDELKLTFQPVKAQVVDPFAEPAPNVVDPFAE